MLHLINVSAIFNNKTITAEIFCDKITILIFKVIHRSLIYK